MEFIFPRIPHILKPISSLVLRNAFSYENRKTTLYYVLCKCIRTTERHQITLYVRINIHTVIDFVHQILLNQYNIQYCYFMNNLHNLVFFLWVVCRFHYSFLLP